MRKQILRTYTQRMAPVVEVGSLEMGNLGGVSILAALIFFAALQGYPGSWDALGMMLIASRAGWTFARMQAAERAVTVTVNETRHVAELGVGEKPPEEP